MYLARNVCAVEDINVLFIGICKFRLCLFINFDLRELTSLHSQVCTVSIVKLYSIFADEINVTTDVTKTVFNSYHLLVNYYYYLYYYCHCIYCGFTCITIYFVKAITSFC